VRLANNPRKPFYDIRGREMSYETIYAKQTPTTKDDTTYANDASKPEPASVSQPNPSPEPVSVRTPPPLPLLSRHRG
jgi:hypothetical protein